MMLFLGLRKTNPGKQEKREREAAARLDTQLDKRGEAEREKIHAEADAERAAAVADRELARSSTGSYRADLLKRLRTIRLRRGSSKRS